MIKLTNSDNTHNILPISPDGLGYKYKIIKTNKNTNHNYLWVLGGKRIYLDNPRPDDFNINTIAIALSRICRYACHTKHFHSVAYHSVLVSQQCPEKLKLHGLLHDASEAYLHDIIKPLKRLPSIDKAYSPIENLFMKAIAKCFDFEYTNKTKKEIKEIERSIELAEIRDLIELPEDEIIVDIKNALPMSLNCEYLPKEASELFLENYYKLIDKVIPY